MQIYGCTIEKQFEGTFYKYTYERYFKSKKEMDEWIHWFNNDFEEKTSLMRVIKKGPCDWNKIGMLTFKKKGE